MNKENAQKPEKPPGIEDPFLGQWDGIIAERRVCGVKDCAINAAQHDQEKQKDASFDRLKCNPDRIPSQATAFSRGFWW